MRRCNDRIRAHARFNKLATSAASLPDIAAFFPRMTSVAQNQIEACYTLRARKVLRQGPLPQKIWEPVSSEGVAYLGLKKSFRILDELRVREVRLFCMPMPAQCSREAKHPETLGSQLVELELDEGQRHGHLHVQKNLTAFSKYSST